MVLKDKYTSYDNALLRLNMESLEERRSTLQLKFTLSGIKITARRYKTVLFPNLHQVTN